MMPNTFEWIILITAIIVIVVTMNMFPICHWLAEKTLGVPKKSDDSETPHE